MRYKLIFISLIIIIILIPFSRRKFNYDDYIYSKESQLIKEYGKKAFNIEQPFLGNIHNFEESTHTVIPGAFYLLIYSVSDNIIVSHLIIYILFSSLVFPLYLLLNSHYKNDRKNIYRIILFLTMPSLLLLSNSLMTDIPGMILFIWGLALFRERSKFTHIVGVVLFILSCLMSYIYGYFIIIMIIDSFMESDKVAKRKKIMELAAASAFLVIILFVLIINHLAPNPLTAIKWTGAEQLFNFHKVGYRFISYLILIGFLSLFTFCSKGIYRDPFFYLCIFLGILFTSALNEYSLISMIIAAILMSIGVYSLLKMFISNGDFKLYHLYFSIFSLIAIIFFPMMIARYILILTLPILIMLTEDMDKICMKAAIVFNIMLSLVFLYSDYVFTEKMYNINYKDNNTDKYYSGEWAFRMGMEEIGASMLMKEDTSFNDGDIIYMPDGMASWQPSENILKRMRLMHSYRIDNFGLALFSVREKCGFYTDEYGVLPFTLVFNDYINIYEYEMITNKSMLMHKYEDAIVLWENPVIPVNAPDSFRFESKGETYLMIEFMDNINVSKYSDGVIVTTVINNISRIDTCMPGISNTIKIYEQGMIELKIDTFNSSQYDWIGIHAEEH